MSTLPGREGARSACGTEARVGGSDAWVGGSEAAADGKGANP
jgi:hypothetical protein